MATLLETRDLHKSFGAVVAAADISLQFEEHQVVGVIGANGAGKTTFINLVTGFLKPTKGWIRYLGRDITMLAPRAITQLGICRSFQIPQLFVELSALDNLLLALGVAPAAGRNFWRPLRSAAANLAALQVLERFGIAEYAKQNAEMLPHGVRKLLDIAMTTVGGPRIVLLDEPTSGISVDEKFAVMETLMAALREQGTTVLFVEHDMEIVERYGERVIAFYDGKVIADGAPSVVLVDPDVRQYVVGAELHRDNHTQGGR